MAMLRLKSSARNIVRYCITFPPVLFNLTEECSKLSWKKNAQEAWYCNNSSVPLGIFRLLYLSLSATGDKPKNKKRDVFGERRVRRNSHSGTASAGTAWARAERWSKLGSLQQPLGNLEGSSRFQDSPWIVRLKNGLQLFQIKQKAFVWFLLSCKVRPTYSYIMYNYSFFCCYPKVKRPNSRG